MRSDPKLLLVAEGTLLLEAIRAIDRSKIQIALVEREGRLVGTLTDGDVRRALLAGAALDFRVEQVMNPSPITAPEGITNEAALAIMRRHSIHQLPVVNADYRVVDIVLIDDLLHASQSDHWVVLMAGGLGTRLKPLTDDLPKPLIKVGDRPILETILRGFATAGFSKFFISVNYKAEMIEDHFGDGSKWGVEIAYLREEAQLGTAGALSLLPDRPKSAFFVMNGDLLTTVNFQQMMQYHAERQSVATVGVREHSVTIPYGVVDFDDFRLLGLREKPTVKYFVNAGVYVLNPGVLDYIVPNEHLDMPNLVSRVIAEGKNSSVFPLREYWIDVGRLDDLQRASEEYEGIFG